MKTRSPWNAPRWRLDWKRAGIAVALVGLWLHALPLIFFGALLWILADVKVDLR